jgi:hypothetical protein
MGFVGFNAFAWLGLDFGLSWIFDLAGFWLELDFGLSWIFG